MRRLSYLIVAAAGLVFSGCTQPSGEYRTKYDSVGQAKRAMEVITAECDTPSTCHPSVASLLVRDGSDVLACTAFLTSLSSIMTNKHCVPENVRSKGARFEHALFKSPAIKGFAAETLTVSEVLDISNFPVGDGIVSQDWAVLKLAAPTRRPAIKISQTSASDGQIFSVYKTNPDLSRRRTNQVVVKCAAGQAGQLTPAISSLRKGFIGLMDCNIFQGNSGSPIIDAEGLARGIVSIQFTPAAKDGEPVPVHGIGTSFACVDIPLLGLRITDQVNCPHP